MKPPRQLQVLDSRRAELETCSYCPKLCRAACPVADAEASDTVTPWGIMSSSYDVALGRLPAEPERAALTWACTGCNGCKSRCDLGNPVRETLLDARAEFVKRRLEPASVKEHERSTGARRARRESALLELRREYGHQDDAPTALLLGCGYLGRLPAESADAVVAARALFGPLRLLSGCCGYAERAAGNSRRADLSAQSLQREAASARRFVAVDAGCAFELAGSAVPFARAALDALRTRATPPPRELGPLRYHDPCMLGRGLGEFEAPRELLARAAGRAVGEFARSREAARCSGAGGLLPVARPETALEIARRRVEEHDGLGGGRIVTACAGSVRALRRAGADVHDLVSVVRQLVER